MNRNFYDRDKMKCYKCKGGMDEFQDETKDGVSYKYFKCEKCGEEIINMKQLHEVAVKSG